MTSCKSYVFFFRSGPMGARAPSAPLPPPPGCAPDSRYEWQCFLNICAVIIGIMEEERFYSTKVRVILYITGQTAEYLYCTKYKFVSQEQHCSGTSSEHGGGGAGRRGGRDDGRRGGRGGRPACGTRTQDAGSGRGDDAEARRDGASQRGGDGDEAARARQSTRGETRRTNVGGHQPVSARGG